MKPAGHDDGAPHDAVIALDAFGQGAALMDTGTRTLRWCSPRFERRSGLAAGAAVQALDRRWPGVAAALMAWGPDGRAHSIDLGDGEALQWVPAQAGLVALRIVEHVDGEHGHAVRRHLEDRERMLFTSRTLSVTEMASTLAHELNQPIGTVTNVLRGLKARLSAAAPADPGTASLCQGVQLALDQALFAARVIARIRDYTHSRQPQRAPLDLACVARESLALLDWEIRRDAVAVELELCAGPCRVVGDEVMLQQLIVNLLRNALEAMRDAPAHRRRLRLKLDMQRRGAEAVLSIRDSGCGLPADADARLFVPFQSTKPNGMGLGLNICRSFAELHQGRLWFTRNEAAADGDCGATFHVVLPTAPAEVCAAH